MTARARKTTEPETTDDHAPSDDHTGGVEPVGGLHLRKGWDEAADE